MNIKVKDTITKINNVKLDSDLTNMEVGRYFLNVTSYVNVNIELEFRTIQLTGL